MFSFEPIPLTPTKSLTELLASEDDLDRLKSLGFTKLVLLSESPVRFAVQASNPGSKRARLFYPSGIKEMVKHWPTVFDTEDILIKDIR